jgi:hypothetical protein
MKCNILLNNSCEEFNKYESVRPLNSHCLKQRNSHLLLHMYMQHDGEDQIQNGDRITHQRKYVYNQGKVEWQDA